MIVTLLTDFGDRDGFVGAMRGVVLSRAPGATLVDLAHHVPRGDVAKASRVLARAAPYFPPGTVHLVVVDPGVGSARRALAVEAAGMRFVAPDNGVLEPFLTGARVHAVSPGPLLPPARGSTFHGRDVFAPIAGALAGGVALERIGPRVGDPVRAPAAAPARAADGRFVGRVVEVDRFGNLITDLPAEGFAAGCELHIGDARLAGPAPCYAAVEPGALAVVVGSEGTLEVAVRDGSAAERLGLTAGAPVACASAPGGPSSAR
ncbi:MAG: SAM-dependent chlorinase/fluorinase [Myxococcales bacterium]|nr:SAM-dependent chlorinase/fluorinase [Myxococcales bacterium]